MWAGRGRVAPLASDTRPSIHNSLHKRWDTKKSGGKHEWLRLIRYRLTALCFVVGCSNDCNPGSLLLIRPINIAEALQMIRLAAWS